ncbi:MAG TPA: glycosyltransferase family 39 protein [Flavitalea sp.]|nr:glycosyltransferase family 39 protein [Flavitalea sp.]
MKGFLLKYHRLLFYSAWLILLCIQSANTELFDDEAYYWVYSKFPAWGYFDHPPAIAILIKAGYGIFHNEFGVRLLTIILSVLSLLIIETLTEKKNPFLFYAICGSLGIAQIGGMIAVPDAPLIFFIALFFFIYKRFERDMSLTNTLLIGLAIALMFYTKYHAILIVLFTGLSNLKLLRSWQIYTACIFAFLLYFPHVYWQHINGYPSFQFHLVERNAAQFRLRNIIEFVMGQLLIAGPLMGWLLIIAAFLYKPASVMERALKFTFAGIFLFFFFISFRGKTEANWTIPSFIGIIVLSHQYLTTHITLRKILYTALPGTLILVGIARIIMISELPPAWWIFKDEFHENKNFVKQVHSRAKENPVVFIDTYQKPSKYWFYSGDTGLALNTTTYRRNNYNFWPIEETYIGRAAYVFGQYDRYYFNNGFILRNGDRNGGRLMPCYFSFSKVRIGAIEINRIDSNQLAVSFTTTTPLNYLVYFETAPYDTASVFLTVYKKNKVVKYIPSEMTVKDIVNEVQHNIVSFSVAMPKGEYECKLAISTCLPGWPSLNSSRFKVTVN